MSNVHLHIYSHFVAPDLTKLAVILFLHQTKQIHHFATVQNLFFLGT